MTKNKGIGMAQPDMLDNSLTKEGGLAGTLNDSDMPASQPLSSSLKPKLDLIFSEVEKNLPDIDFDCSDVDSDNEEPILFHHHLNSLEEDKDLDTSQGNDTLAELAASAQKSADKLTISINEADKACENPFQIYDNDLAYELQKGGFKFASPVVASWADIPVPLEKDKNKQPSMKDDQVVPCSYVQKDNDKVYSWNDIQQSSMVSADDKSMCVNSESSVSLNSMDDKVIRKQLERESNRNKERELATRLVSFQAPILSTTVLDNIDFDALLQSVNTDNQYIYSQPGQAWPERHRNDGSGEGNRNTLDNMSYDSGGCMTLIQKLAQISMSQYGEDLTNIDPSTGAIRKQGNWSTDINDADVETVVIPPDVKERRIKDDRNKDLEAEKQKPKQTSCCGTNTMDLKSPKIIIPRTHPEFKQEVVTKGDKDPTVFIDLRNFEQNRQEEQENIKRVQKVLGIQPDQRSESESEDDVDDWREKRLKIKEHIVSSAKTTKMHAANDKPPIHSQPPRVINISKMQSQNRVISVGETPERQMASNRKTQTQQQPVEEKDQKHELIKKLREQREHERQTKLRLQKRLDALRPSASVSGKQDPAENTPTVYDLDASYETAPRSLPPVLSPDTDCVLLTVHLSSNGEIVLHRSSGNKSVDTDKGLSASYTTLLTWLLDMVPRDYTYLQDSATEPTLPWVLPFYVVGLQQLLMDGQLYLMVAVTPAEQFYSRHLLSKSKKNKNSTAFQQHLQKYLSTNTLHTVCPWLQNIVPMDLAAMTSTDGSDIPDYVYRPLLPNVTTKPLSTFITINPDPQAATKVFNSSVGFFWQTVDNDESRLDQDIHDEGVNFDTQNTLSLVYKKLYQDPVAMSGIFHRVLQLGLDLAGVRLVYPTQEQMNMPEVDNAAKVSELELLNKIGAVLAICIRGTAARSLWLDAVGPSDPVLARRTDPNSLYALYGGESRDECHMFCPRTSARVQTELARWFGGRVPPGNVIDVGTPYSKKEALRGGSPKGKRGKKGVVIDTEDFSIVSEDSLSCIHRPLAMLTATIRSEILFVVSPVVMPKCFGIILSSFQNRGFQITGVKRCRLSTKRAATLGISESSLKAFCPGFVPESFEVAYVDPNGQMPEASMPATIFQLLKENASHNAASLIEDCVVQLTLQGIMGTLQRCESYPLEAVHLFHTVRYSDNLISALGGEFSKCFDPEIQINPSYVIPALYTNPEMEQITVLLFLGHDAIKSSGQFIGKILGMVPYSKLHQVLPFVDCFELLGMKWLPCLSIGQAKEVTPYEVGDKYWKESLYALTKVPCLAFALRGVNAFSKLETIVSPCLSPSSKPDQYNLDIIYARTAEQAYTFIKQFFTEKELFFDPLARHMMPYMPLFQHQHECHVQKLGARSKKDHTTYPAEETIFEMMLAGPRPFTTFLIIKPRAFQKHVSKILKKLTQEGFVIVGLRLQVLTVQDSLRILTQVLDDKEKHIEHLMSGPSLLLVVQRENAVWKLQDLLGPEDPQSARRLSQFYWRGVFGTDIVANGFYASRIYLEALEDQKYFFPEGLCCEETQITLQEGIVCPAIDQQLDLKHNINREVVYVRKHEGSIDTTDISHGLLLQTTCIVLSPLLVKKVRSHYGYVDIIDGLVSQGFEFVGARMLWFTQEQAEHFLVLIEAGSFQMVPLLVSGTSIVLALERDNAVVAFDTILNETFSTESSQGKTVTDSLLHKYGKLILRPPDIKQANNTLGYFFQELLPNSHLQIINKTTLPLLNST